MDFNNGIAKQNRQIISESLSRFLADTYAIYLKTQNFHWNLTGGEFYSLHILFEKQYTELAEAIDEIAERIRALGFYVEGSFTAFLELTSIKEEIKVLSSKEMLVNLLEAHETLIRSARRLSSLAEKEDDPATVDLMGRRLNIHEKFSWMLRGSCSTKF